MNKENIESPNVQDGKASELKQAAIDWCNFDLNDDSGGYEAFIDGAKWQSQHSYTEAEVLAIIEQVKGKCEEVAIYDKWYVNQQSIKDINFKYLLK